MSFTEKLVALTQRIPNITCGAGACVGGAAPSCDDGNVCTDDSCDSATGCVNSSNTAACDDGDACTTADTCAAGACVGGAAPSCDDGNVCTDDSTLENREDGMRERVIFAAVLDNHKGNAERRVFFSVTGSNPPRK